VYVRVIPRLDIKGPNLVKGVHMEGLRVLGKPEHFARHYYENGADELYFMDAVASLYERNSLLDIIERTAREIFIPLTVGGGLRSVEDIRTVLRAGADKVSINTAAIRDPQLVSQAARAFGSSTIVVAIDANRRADGSYENFVEYGREPTGVDPFEWAKRAVELGAGELLVTSINNEGTGKGFDMELVRRIAASVSVPVIAGGGAGTIEHINQAVTEGDADAVSVASILHYNVIRHGGHDDEEFVEEGNVEFLKGRRGNVERSSIQDTTLSQIKEGLAAQGIPCRLAQVTPAHG
jgi:cyclase